MDEEKYKTLISIYQTLPSEMQCAVLWVVEHIDVVDDLAQGERAPEKEIEDLIQKEIEKENYLFAVLLIYKRVYDINA